MEVLEWNDKTMGIGIKLIDDQHKELLKIMNQLETSIHENSQRRDILTIVDELIDYAAYHFITEEKMFDKIDYEEAEIHKKEHAEFVEKFDAIKNKISNDEFYLMKSAIEISDDIFNYIISWFIEHITGSDRRYVELLKGKGIKY